jgi:hypothetical protein
MFLKNLNLKLVYHETINLLVIFLLCFLPFNAILKVVSVYGLGIPNVSLLKEILIILLAMLMVFNLKKVFENRLIIATSVIYLVYICVSLLWLNDPSISGFINGFKFDGIYIVCLLIGLLIPKEISNNWLKYVKISVLANLISLSIGAFFHFVIKPKNLTFLGFRNDWSTFIKGESLAFCQKIENSPICRFQGLFSGPNQAGANILLLATNIILLTTTKVKQFGTKYSQVILWLIILVCLFATFSRSSWLAFITLIVLIGLNLKKNIKVFAYISIFTIIVAGLTMSFLPETVLRYGSNSERVQLMKEGISQVATSPLIGQGIGFSGPASHGLENPIITENWFIQVAINYGLIGFALYLLLYFAIIRKLLSTKNYAYFALFIALLIPLNLLHYFEDSSFAYTLFLLTGLFINKET